MEVWLDVIKAFGPNIALIGFIMWRDTKREERMATALDNREKAQNQQSETNAKQLVDLVREGFQVQREGFKTQQEGHTAILKLSHAVETLPCRDVCNVNTPKTRRESDKIL